MTDMPCLPDSLQNRTYYKPGSLGSEVKVAVRMEQIRQMKEQMRKERIKKNHENHNASKS